MSAFLVPPLVVATFTAVAIAWVKRMPTWQQCPTCQHRTQALVPPPWLKPLSRWLVIRWCPDCHWEKLGRNGPEWVPGRQVAHDSGFHWGDDVMGENMGFEWRRPEAPETVAGEPPHHPSGFRFAEGSEPEHRGAAHTSGFAWRRRTPETGEGGTKSKAAHRSGFRWGERRTPDRPQDTTGHFAWKKPGDRRDRGKPKDGGFQWGRVD